MGSTHFNLLLPDVYQKQLLSCPWAGDQSLWSITVFLGPEGSHLLSHRALGKVKHAAHQCTLVWFPPWTAWLPTLLAVSEVGRFRRRQAGAETRAPRGWLTEGGPVPGGPGRHMQPGCCRLRPLSPPEMLAGTLVFPWRSHGQGLRPAGEACERLLLSLAWGGGSVKVEDGILRSERGKH